MYVVDVYFRVIIVFVELCELIGDKVIVDILSELFVKN